MQQPSQHTKTLTRSLTLIHNERRDTHACTALACARRRVFSGGGKPLFAVPCAPQNRLQDFGCAWEHKCARSAALYVGSCCALLCNHWIITADGQARVLMRPARWRAAARYTAVLLFSWWWWWYLQAGRVRVAPVSIYTHIVWCVLYVNYSICYM